MKEAYHEHTADQRKEREERRVLHAVCGHPEGGQRIPRLQPDYANRWLHSDIKNLAFPYVRKAFDKILEVGGLE